MTKTFRPDNCKVSINNNNGSFQLRFTWKGVRQNLNLGIPYSPEGMDLAIAMAYRIDSDLKSNAFVSKEYYKMKNSDCVNSFDYVLSPPVSWDLLRIFEFYCDLKPNPDSEVARIRATLFDWLLRSPKQMLSLDKVDEWLNFLRYEIPHNNNKGKGYSDKYIACLWRILKSAVNFAIALDKVSCNNPLIPLYKSLDTKVYKEIRVYSSEEIQVILSAFRDNIYCSKFSRVLDSFYADFVEFRFLTGARPSETVPLTCNDVVKRNGKTLILFNKRYVKGVLKKGLKNGKVSRYFPCNEQLLSVVNRVISFRNELLFCSPNGGFIHSANFARRFWNRVIKGLVNDGLLPFAIPFYDERHCFGSIVCRKTHDVKTVSSIMGNSPQTLYKYYLADDPFFDVPFV